MASLVPGAPLQAGGHRFGFRLAASSPPVADVVLELDLKAAPACCCSSEPRRRRSSRSCAHRRAPRSPPRPRGRPLCHGPHHDTSLTQAAQIVRDAARPSNRLNGQRRTTGERGRGGRFDRHLRSSRGGREHPLLDCWRSVGVRGGDRAAWTRCAADAPVDGDERGVGELGEGDVAGVVDGEVLA